MLLKMMSELKTLKHLDMISKPTNAHKCMKLHYTHRIPPHMFWPLVAIFERFIAKDRYIKILLKFFNHYTDIKY